MRRLVPSLLALAFALAPAAAAAGAPPPPPPREAIRSDPKVLLTAFKLMPGLEARFEETKHLALLAAPLVSKGRLYFAPPGYLARHVEHPTRSRVVITPTELRFDDGTGAGKIDLRARPDVKTFVESFARLLAGDYPALAAIYTVRFTPAPAEDQPWLLELAPKGPPLSKLVKHLRVRGVGLAVQEIRVAETSGDETVTRILSADPARRFTAEEHRRLFGAPAK